MSVRFVEVGLDSSDQYRIDSVFTGLYSLFEHPFGGQIERKYFHNMWLDVGRVGGVFPFLFLLLYSINTLSHAIRLFMQKGLGFVYRYIVFSVFIGVLINCISEPVMEGMMEHYLVFVFFNGLIEADFLNLSQKMRRA